MAQQDENSDGAEEIQRQFALLQEEMRRVMRDQQAGTEAASPPAQPAIGATAEEEAQFRRIEAWLEELRRGTDQQAPAVPADPAVTEAVGRLRANVEQIAAQSAEVAKRAEDSAARLARTVQTQRQAIADVTSRVDRLARRQGRWMTPVAILLGALVIAAAVLAGDPGRVQMLIDRFNAIVFPDRPHAETVAPATMARQAPTDSPQPSPPQSSPPQSSSAESPPTAPPPPPSPAPVPAPIAQAADQLPPPVVTPAEPPTPTPRPVQAILVPDTPKAPPAPAPAQAPPSATAAVADAPTSPAPKDPASKDLAAVRPPALATLTPPAQAPAPFTEPPPARSRIVLRAKSDTWVEVRNRQGGTLLSRTLHSGDSWSVPDQDSLVLSTGNAGGLMVLIDGNPAPPLGASGAVRRDVPLDADLLRAGRPAPEPSTRARPSTASR